MHETQARTQFSLKCQQQIHFLTTSLILLCAGAWADCLIGCRALPMTLRLSTHIFYTHIYYEWVRTLLSLRGVLFVLYTHTHMCACTHSQRCFAQMFTAREAEIQKLYIIMGGPPPSPPRGRFLAFFNRLNYV